jgi:hypothetical protein
MAPLINRELKSMWKEVFVINFEIVINRIPGETEEIIKI